MHLLGCKVERGRDERKLRGMRVSEFGARAAAEALFCARVFAAMHVFAAVCDV